MVLLFNSTPLVFRGWRISMLYISLYNSVSSILRCTPSEVLQFVRSRKVERIRPPLLLKTPPRQLYSRVSVPLCSSPISYMSMHLPEYDPYAQLFACRWELLVLASLSRVYCSGMVARILYFPPRFASRNSTFFLTDGRVVNYTLTNRHPRDMATTYQLGRT